LATGNALGGAKVDAAFVELLEITTSKEIINATKRSDPAGWLEFMCKFEQKKKSIRNRKGGKMKIELPYSLSEEATKATGKPLDNVINDVKYPGVRCVRMKLELDLNTISTLFSISVDGIIQHMESLLAKKELADISHVLMVGGYAECPILQLSGSKTSFC
jgi:molecular chaperone DnaK (HSP70)